MTDLGSGTGVLTRAPDTILAIRPHKEDDYHVLDFVRRSGPDPESFAAQFRFPLWQADDEIEPVIREPTGRAGRKQASRDEQGKSDIKKSIKRGKNSKNAVRSDLGMGLDRLNRLFRQLVDAGEIRVSGISKHRNGTEYETYEIST